ncbi:DMT family transporter [Alginatibacterium sediminis]|nr:DMT family transporter [Alginatibacterium sediminis]
MSQKKSYLYGLAAVLMWSTVATAFKLSLEMLQPMQLVLLASATSILVLLVILSFQKRLYLVAQCIQQRPWYYLSLGVINPFLYYAVLFAAYDLLPAQQAQSLNYTWAITLSLLAVPFLGHKLRAVDLVAMLFGYLGVVVIATRGQIMSMQFDSLSGVGLALLSTLIWAGYWILNTRNQADAVASLLAAFLLGFPIILVACYFSVGLPSFNPKAWLAASYVGIFEMGIAFVCWVKALKLSNNTAKISNLIFISPFLSLFFISHFLDEPIESATFIGLAMIVVGLLISQKKSKTKQS